MSSSAGVALRGGEPVASVFKVLAFAFPLRLLFDCGRDAGRGSRPSASNSTNRAYRTIDQAKSK